MVTKPWIAFDHLVLRLETGRSDVGHGQTLVSGLIRAQNWRIGHQRKVNSIISLN